MQIKLKDVARATGYSITTVSRALAGYSDVAEQTRDHILAKAQEMGYQPNLLARQLRSQSSQTLGLIVPADDRSFSGDFFSQLMLGISAGATEHQYDLLISGHHSEAEEMNLYKRIVGGNRVDGMILARTRRHDPRIAWLKSVGHPFVVSGRGDPNEKSDFSYIDVDSRAGMCSIVQYLIEMGHMRIGLLLPPAEMAFTGYRLAGYQDALRSAQIPYRAEYVRHSDLTRAGGKNAVHDLLREHPEISAIAACNDLMALGAMNAVEALGREVGKDISITGFDDIPIAEHAQPPLTTIHQPIYDIGRQLADMLIQHIETGLPEQHLILPVELIRRASVGKYRS